MTKFIPLASAALFALSACNTFEGMGKDVQQGGAARVVGVVAVGLYSNYVLITGMVTLVAAQLLAAVTPGPYLHLGGDEVETLTEAEYAAFVEFAQATVARTGRTFMGWDDVAEASLAPGAVLQVWRPQVPAVAVVT